MADSNEYVTGLGQKARCAGYSLATLDGATRAKAIRRMAVGLRAAKQKLLEANAKDVEAAVRTEVAGPLVARLKLDEKKIEAMAVGVEQIAEQVDPIGQTIEGFNRPNGLRVEKRRAPLGVVLFFYESRPNVTSDAAALCIKSGNAIILRGGKEAFASNQIIAQVISESLKEAGIDPNAVQLVESTDRALVPALLKLDKYIDLVIPRGGESLIRAVVAESTIPVLKHYTGNCHIYIDQAFAGMEEEIRAVCVNSKTSYPGGAVCNAVEHLLFHQKAAEKLLAVVCGDLAAKGVEVRGDERARRLYPPAKETTEADWDTEYLAFVVGVKVVDSMDEAVEHINAHGSHHTDAILSSNVRTCDQFVREIDSASIMVNASTRFADGGEYGLGAEIGISTDKMHARSDGGDGFNNV